MVKASQFCNVMKSLTVSSNSFTMRKWQQIAKFFEVSMEESAFPLSTSFYLSQCITLSLSLYCTISHSHYPVYFLLISLSLSTFLHASLCLFLCIPMSFLWIFSPLSVSFCYSPMHHAVSFFYLILSPPAISRSPTFSNRFISLSLYRFLSISFSLLSPYLSFFLVSLLISLFNFVFLCISTSSILSLILSFYVSHPLPSCP
jgi:hypothetical protein